MTAPKKISANLKVDGDVLQSGGVLEQMLATFTYDEFRQMAFSKSVMFNIGSMKNFEITLGTRNKWRILCNYFELIKSKEKPTSTTQGI